MVTRVLFNEDCPVCNAEICHYRNYAEKKGIEISDLDAREHVYGIPYSEWKEKYQK